MRLIIAEKRSVAASIASALGATSRADSFYEGNDLLVSWCVGHLVSPMDAAGYDPRFRKWHFEDLPILPEPFRYVLAPGKEAAFENLRALMDRPDVDTIVNACDAGREGELIFRLVYEMAGGRKPVRRLWISSMEDNAIREGFSDLRPGADYEALYQSALCRQKADWLVGINATRLFSVLYHRTLNVGRVLTPTLAMLVERERKISQFQKEKYYVLRLEMNGTEAVSEKLNDSTEVERAAAACKGVDGMETVYVQHTGQLKVITQPYNSDTDALLGKLSEQATAVILCPGDFLILFPQDAHMPGCHAHEPSSVKKVIGKIRI